MVSSAWSSFCQLGHALQRKKELFFLKKHPKAIEPFTSVCGSQMLIQLSEKELLTVAKVASGNIISLLGEAVTTAQISMNQVAASKI